MSSLLCLLFARCLYACWYLSYAGYALQVNINTHFYSVRAVSLTTVMGPDIKSEVTSTLGRAVVGSLLPKKAAKEGCRSLYRGRYCGQLKKEDAEERHPTQARSLRLEHSESQKRQCSCTQGISRVWQFTRAACNRIARPRCCISWTKG